MNTLNYESLHNYTIYIVWVNTKMKKNIQMRLCFYYFMCPSFPGAFI